MDSFCIVANIPIARSLWADFDCLSRFRFAALLKFDWKPESLIDFEPSNPRRDSGCTRFLRAEIPLFMHLQLQVSQGIEFQIVKFVDNCLAKSCFLCLDFIFSNPSQARQTSLPNKKKRFVLLASICNFGGWVLDRSDLSWMLRLELEMSFCNDI